jgi:hypothetical protein
MGGNNRIETREEHRPADSSRGGVRSTIQKLFRFNGRFAKLARLF